MHGQLGADVLKFALNEACRDFALCLKFSEFNTNIPLTFNVRQNAIFQTNCKSILPKSHHPEPCFARSKLPASSFVIHVLR